MFASFDWVVSIKVFWVEFSKWEGDLRDPKCLNFLPFAAFYGFALPGLLYISNPCKNDVFIAGNRFVLKRTDVDPSIVESLFTDDSEVPVIKNSFNFKLVSLTFELVVHAPSSILTILFGLIVVADIRSITLFLDVPWPRLTNFTWNWSYGDTFFFGVAFFSFVFIL